MSSVESKSSATVLLPTMRVLLEEYHYRANALRQTYPGLHVQTLTPNLLALHSKVRNANASRKDFVFYSQRILRMLMEEALNLLPYTPVDILTPTKFTFHGCSSDFENLVCGVSILRAGSAMETVFRAVLKDAPLGQILIQRDEESKDKHAKLFYAKIPADVASRKVLLMDPMLATGGSAIVAIAALIERGVNSSNIIFVNLVSSPEGIKAVLGKYPEIKIITSMVDDHLNDEKYICPGLGDFGDLYFGTGHFQSALAELHESLAKKIGNCVVWTICSSSGCNDDVIMYHERQEWQFCGIHCVNNLLQQRACDKAQFDDWASAVAQEEQRHGLSSSWLNPHKSLLGIGNFDVNVLMKALESLGYNMKWVDRRKRMSDIVHTSLMQNHECIGMVCNVKQSGIMSSILNSRHWIAIGKIRSEEEKDSQLYNLDSKLNEPCPLSEEQLVKLLEDWIKNADANLFLVTKKKNPDQ